MSKRKERWRESGGCGGKRESKKKDTIKKINLTDDKIAQLIADMGVTAREDGDLNENKKPAVKKIAMLS